MKDFEDENELLLRQVHPNFIVEHRLTSQAFLPTAKDDKRLSVNRNSMISAKEAFELHTEAKKLRSAGVWAVSCEEVKSLEAMLIENDPIDAPIKDESHALINFSKLPSESRIKANAKHLTAKARDRECLFTPD